MADILSFPQSNISNFNPLNLAVTEKDFFNVFPWGQI